MTIKELRKEVTSVMLEQNLAEDQAEAADLETLFKK